MLVNIGRIELPMHSLNIISEPAEGLNFNPGKRRKLFKYMSGADLGVGWGG